MKLGYLAIDQNGYRVKIDKYPRKELMAHTGIKHASKQYNDKKDGSIAHTGYILGSQWFTIYEIHSWRGGKVL